MRYTKTGSLIVLLLLIFSLVPVSVFAAEEEEWHGVDELAVKNDYVSRFASIQRGYLKGYTKYHIAFSGGASELEFPLDNNIWGVTAGFTFKADPQDVNNVAKLEFNWSTNVGHDAGKMKDSDWLDNDNHDGLDVYSESDASLAASFMDINYFYNLYPDKYYSFGPKIGYQRIRFSYDISNANQVGYGPYAAETVSISGKVLDYQVDYEIIYIGLNALYGSPDNILYLAGFSYSPWAKARDRDDHIAREKLNEAETDGDNYSFNGSVEYHFLPDWSVSISGQYNKIYTTGKQHQEYYGATGEYYKRYYGTSDLGYVDDTISAVWWQAAAGIKYWF